MCPIVPDSPMKYFKKQVPDSPMKDFKKQVRQLNYSTWHVSEFIQYVSVALNDVRQIEAHETQTQQT